MCSQRKNDPVSLLEWTPALDSFARTQTKHVASVRIIVFVSSALTSFVQQVGLFHLKLINNIYSTKMLAF